MQGRDLTDPGFRVPDVAVVNGTQHVVYTCVPRTQHFKNIYIYYYYYYLFFVIIIIIIFIFFNYFFFIIITSLKFING